MSSSGWTTVPSRTWGNSALRLAPTVATPAPTFPNGNIPMSRPPRLVPAAPVGLVVPPKEDFPALCSKPVAPAAAAAPKPMTFSALVKKRADEEVAVAEAESRRRAEEESKRLREALDLRMAGIHTRVAASSSQRYSYEADYEENAYGGGDEDDLDALDMYEQGRSRYRNADIDYDVPPEDAYDGNEDYYEETN